MPGFIKGQDPITELSVLKRFMKDNIAKANESPTVEKKLEYLEKAHAEHFQKMGSLTTIYKGGNEQVDLLKTQIRSLYEQMLAMKQDCKDALGVSPVVRNGLFARKHDTSSEESEEIEDIFNLHY